MGDDLGSSLTQISLQLRQRSGGARALCEKVIDNHYRHQASFGAYQGWDESYLRQQADAADKAMANGFDLGPFHGLPVSVKDLYGVKGYATFAGSPRQLPFLWEKEGLVVKAVRNQLALITGKTHTVEFAFGGLGVNPHWETPRNPWDSDKYRVPGGSSSGAGVSLCVGTAAFALGTDTAGSVRIPASMTGNVGLKTTLGRWPVTGIVPLSASLDTPGFLSRTVADAQYVFSALDWAIRPTRSGPFCSAQIDVAALRLGVSDGLLWDQCSPGIAEGVQTALQELSGKGARLVAIPFPEADEVDPVFRIGGLAAVELYEFLKSQLPEWIPLLDPKIQQRMADAATLTASEYLRRARLFKHLAESAAHRLRDVDVLVSPTVALTPPALEEIEGIDQYRDANLLSLRNTAVVNYLGLCALTLPVALDGEGMPVGMQLIARPFEEQKLLCVAAAIERCLGTGQRRLGRPPRR